MRGPRAWLVALAALGAGLIPTGCGTDDETASVVREPPSAGLTIAISGRPLDDPLAAHDLSSQIVLRQVYEPLVGPLLPPFARAGDRPGLARGLRPTSHGTVWIIRLRRGIRFSDGESFNAGAVALNARRWATERVALLPGLTAADAPRSDQVRLIFSRPAMGVERALSDPRLGIVSPASIRQRERGPMRFIAADAAGTGPFTLAAESSDRVELDRSPGWWGSELGLGPALQSAAFLIEPDPQRRLELLAADEVEVATGVADAPARTRRQIRRDPLLGILRSRGGPIAHERSVRGLSASDRVPALSSVWLTSVGRPATP